MKHGSDFFTLHSEFRALVKTQHLAVKKCFCCFRRGVYFKLLYSVTCIQWHYEPIVMYKYSSLKSFCINKTSSPCWKLHVPCSYPPMSLVHFGEKSFLPLHMSLIAFCTQLWDVSLWKIVWKTSWLFLIMCICVYMLCFYDLMLGEPNCLQNIFYVYSWGSVLVKRDIDVRIR